MKDEAILIPAQVIAENLAAKDASRVKQKYEWADEAAIQTNLAVSNAYAALMAAFSRCLATVGETRSPSRNRTLRLLHLAEEGQMAQNEIGRELGVTSANVTYLIDGLEKEGLVTRVTSTTDRRVTYVRLTEDGRAKAAELVPLTAEFMATICRDFTDEEKATLNRLLERFRWNAETSYRND